MFELVGRENGITHSLGFNPHEKKKKKKENKKEKHKTTNHKQTPNFLIEVNERIKEKPSWCTSRGDLCQRKKASRSSRESFGDAEC